MGGWKYHPTASLVKSAVPLQPIACFGGANLYTSIAFCIRLNSSRIHSSNNNAAVCAAPFISVYALQLLIQCAYQQPQSRTQPPLNFEYSASCTLRACSSCKARTFYCTQIKDPQWGSWRSPWPDLDTFALCFTSLNLMKLKIVQTVFTAINGNELKVLSQTLCKQYVITC